MFFMIYKTTNTKTGEFYVGQHVTEDLNDGYLGSGRGIIENIKAHGREFFEREVLFLFENEVDMDSKEREIVNEDFLSNPLVLNRSQGGQGSNFARGSIVVFLDGKWRRIRINEFDPLVHITPTAGTVWVYDTLQGVKRRVPCVEYQNNKDRYKTSSAGKVSVMHLETGKTSSVGLSDYDPFKHKKVLGGIVAEVEGKLQYVSKEQFTKENLKGCHKGKVTVLDSMDGSRKHVTRQEFSENRDRYTGLSCGTVSALNTDTGKFQKVSLSEFHSNPEKFKATTTGQRTVWDIMEKRFKNIPKEKFNRDYHRLSSDKRIMCHNSEGDVIIDFWGTKLDFIKVYSNLLYEEALKQTKNYQPKQRKKFAKYVGCSFTLINWINQNEQH